SLFNTLLLVSRTSNTLLTPTLTKRVESALGADLDVAAVMLNRDFQLLMLSASLATLVGSMLIPSFQRYVTTVVASFDRFPSLPRLAKFALSKPGFTALTASWAVPSKANFQFLKAAHRLPWNIFTMNVIGSALLATGVLSSL